VSSAWIEGNFPRLLAGAAYDERSPIDFDYNCIAFAAGETHRFWWPPPPAPLSGGSYWPPGVAAEETLAAFVAAFESLGYDVCADGSFESAVEKVAIYAKNGVPTHAARQSVAEGKWLSKLGRAYDIAHDDPDGVGGEPGYGDVVVYMQRPI
jgi:hypothetical protein